ncbi:ABC-type branched-chain amino acid transport system, periplasmic component [Herbaspirillum sp. CF444]|uniref:branched-chain amino acid ABC transporter substrate-binding protein n=1 Tax=Herbaspirillum sp. CF444 TaxID=1144319 RepID=UPI0002724C5B|nr:branched-chain amino acid ABC transporter substrate-binding protein [Herbaspirillum sp. CF444]EJL83378.1 ABC-type branched-chain amino acid transport system, periplasmic component [Herbaspirillum sp. CF444]
MRLFFRTAASVFLFLSLSAAMAQQQTVMIGVVGPMSVPSGQSTRDGVQFALDRINRQGLRIDGKNVTLKMFQADDKNDPNLAVIDARAAVAAGVVGVIGHLTTDASIAAAKIYSDAGVAQLSPTAAGREFTRQGYQTVFQMLGSSDHTARYLAETAIKVLRAKRIIVIDNDSILGRELAKSFRASVIRMGGNIVGTDKVNFKSSDFNSVMANIRNSDADLVFFAGVVPQSIAFATRFQQIGLHTQLLLAGGAINPAFPLKTEEYPDGTLLLAHGNPVEKVPDFKRLEKEYRQQYTSPLIPQTWFAYDAVAMLVEAMKRTDSLSPNMLSSALHQMKYNGLSGSVSFAADGSQENPHYTLYRAEQKTWKTLNTLP